MPAADRLLEASAEASIAEQASDSGFNFTQGQWQGQWTYQQLVCPALPNHLFLRFMRSNGSSDVSVFSASIPRNSAGRIRVIPIERRGYSLFSPAPVNALTIAAFNRIRAEEAGIAASDVKGGADAAPAAASSWIGLGLCYAALAGANPLLATEIAAPETAAPESATPRQEPASARSSPSASSPVLEILPDGGAVIHFTDLSASPRPLAWSLTFNGKGKLLKAEHKPAGIAPEAPAPNSDAEQKAKPVPAS
jgi:hypothetical protein